MTLTEIKIPLENLLENLTIDDLRVVSPLQIVKQKFAERHGWKTDSDVEIWLSKEAKNSEMDVLKVCSAKIISDTIKEINHKTGLFENLKKEIGEREEEANKVHSDINNDFITHKITHVELSEKNKLLEVYIQQTSVLRKTKRTTDAEIKKHKDNLRLLKKTQKRIGANKSEFFINEKQSLDYLFKVLFFKEISMQPVEGFIQKSTGLVFNLDELDPAITANADEYRKTVIDYEIKITNLETKGVIESIVTTAHSARTIPARWKTVLEETFAKPIPDNFGSLSYVDVHGEDYDSEKNKGFCFTSYETRRTYLDEAALLLLKEASQTNNYLTTEDQKVLFALPNGVSATLLFRKKGERMQAFFTRPLEIVINRTIKQEEKPATQSYYLINEDYVIEVEFIFSKLFSATEEK